MPVFERWDFTPEPVRLIFESLYLLKKLCSPLDGALHLLPQTASLVFEILDDLSELIFLKLQLVYLDAECLPFPLQPSVLPLTLKGTMHCGRGSPEPVGNRVLAQPLSLE
jgi:hypothetical protein